MKNKIFLKKTVYLKALFFICVLFFKGIAVFADEYEPEIPLSELEKEDFQDSENLNINPELQKNFTIIINRLNYNLNPHTSQYSSEAQILNGLYEGLFSYDPVTLEPIYAYAKSFRISRNKKRWTFELKENILFSDGTPITAEDFRLSWLYLLKNPLAPYSSLLDVIQGAQDFRLGKTTAESVGIYALDEKTISIQLKNPASHLPRLLCMPSFSVVSKNQGVFSGAFTVDSVSENALVLKRNEYYYDAKKTALEKITFLFSSDEEENTALFNMGKVDWLNANFNSKKLLVPSCTKISAEFATQYIFFKLQPKSMWRAPELRQALLEAVPWEKLRENTYVKASSLIYPLNGYPPVEGYVFTDLAEAKLMMKQARENLTIPDEYELSLKFAIPATDSFREKAKLLKDAWQELGVKVEIIEIDEFEYLNQIDLIPADLFTYTWIGDFADPLAFLELFRGNSTLNVTNWNNKKYNSLLDEAVLYSDENHNKLLAKAEQLLLDEALILPIQHPVSVNVINYDAVGGWATNAFDIHPLKYLFKKETKDKIPNIALQKLR